MLKKKEKKNSYTYYTIGYLFAMSILFYAFINSGTMLLSKGSCKLLLPQKLESLNDGRPCGERVLSFQPHLQHTQEALVSVTLVVCSDCSQGGHG